MNLAFLHSLGLQGNNCGHRYRAEKMSELGFSTILYLHSSWFLFFSISFICLCSAGSPVGIEAFALTAAKFF